MRGRRKKHSEHGGMWKVAYADFMTAMMVLFLMLWIVNNISEEQLSGLGNYFSPSILKESTEQLDNKAQSMLANKEVKYKISHLTQQLQKRLRKVDKNISVKENDKEIIITIMSTKEKVLFSTKSFQLSSLFNEEINLIVNEIKNTSFYIAIVGHTNGVEIDSNAYYANWELSADRASAVRHTLIKLGLDRQRIFSIIGKADIDPWDVNDPELLQNRRVDIKLLKNEQQIGQHRKNTPGIFN